MHIGNWKHTCCIWAHTGLSKIELFLCHFQQEGVRTIFIHQVKSHWHVLSWYVAGMVNAAVWRWQWWLRSTARWDCFTLPPHHPPLPQSAVAPVLDWTNNHRRPGAASLATKITWANTMWLFLWNILRTVFLMPLPQNLLELQRQIIAAISATDCDMLQQVWAEMDYQLEVCRVTKGGHTYHFWGMKKKLVNFSSICRSHVTILSGTHAVRFYEMSWNYE